MTLDEKRQVIEVLLCAVIDPDPPRDRYRDVRTTNEAAIMIGAEDFARYRAAAEWVAARATLTADHSHGHVCLEAAYRLIESSPTLRREWFGR